VSDRKREREQRKKGNPETQSKKKTKREHEPNKDYIERSIAFTIAFVPVDNETKKQN
jgi:hypothetical protein